MIWARWTISGERVSGVFEKKEIGPNLLLLESMGRNTDKIVVVGDASETYRTIEREIRTDDKNLGLRRLLI